MRAIWEGNSCLLSLGAPDSPVHTGHCPVRISFLKWRSRPLAALEPLVHRTLSGAHRTVRCTPDSPVPPPDRWLGHVSCADRAADRWPGRPLAHRTVRCTPDSPVNYSRTPPIEFSRAASSHEPAWRTGHCPVHHRTVRCSQTEQSLGCSSQDISNLFFSCFQHLDTIH